MTVYNWSALTNNQQIAFNPSTDRLSFDSSTISAANLQLSWASAATSITYDGKAITLLADVKALTTTNVTFANGSLLIVGDNTTGTVADSGANVLTGSAQGDMLIGFGGNDTINGGAGNDTYVYSEDWSGNSQITDTSGTTDKLVWFANTDWDPVNAALPVVTYAGRDATGNNLVGITFKNEITDHTITIFNEFSQNNVTAIEGIQSASMFYGNVNFGGVGTIIAGFTGSDGSEIIIGTTAGDLITGNGGDDNLQGGDGADTIYGGAGMDGITGGAGNDLIYGGVGLDDIIGGDGNDVIYTNSESTQVTISSDEAWGEAGNDSLIGGDGTDGLSGGSGNDTLDGAGGADELNGGPGDDLLIGGSGNDNLDGADGVDTARFAATFASSRINKNADGSYTIVSATDGTDTLKNIEYAQFSDQTVALTGGALYNWSTLTNDQQIAFNPSTDKLSFDSSSISAASLSLSWVSNTSTSISYGGKSITLQTDVKALTPTNITFANGSLLLIGDNATATTGDDSSNNLNGSSQADLLLGLGGDDQLNGGIGNDFIDGGAGSNGLFGAAGNDTLIGGAGQDYFIGGSGNDSMNGGDGTDTVDYADNGYDSAGVSTSGVSVNLLTGIAIDNWGGTDSLVNIEMVNSSNLADRVTGDANGNMINGYGGNDSIDGGAGNDWLIGQAGDDLLIGGAGGDLFTGGSGNDTINGGEGPDTVQYSYSGYSGAESPSTGIKINLQTGIAIDSWGGTDTLIDIEHVNGSILDDQITGNSFDNQLNGDAGNDTLYGASGNDLLVGSSGNDNLDGGDGVDTARFDATFASTRITKNADGSYTIVSASDGTDTLKNIEYAQFSDQTVALTGGALYNWSTLTNNQQIAFNPSTDKLSFDSTTISAASLSLSWVSNTSTSFSYGGKSITLQTDVKALTSTNVTFANGSLLIIGDDTNNPLRGSAQADYIFALGGDDGLDGGGGNDFIDGGANGQFGDSISFSGATVGVNVNLTLGLAEDGQGGVDTIQNLEHIIGTQYSDTLIGNSSTNWFTPGSGNDYVDGGSNTDVVFYEDATAAVNVNLITGIASGQSIGTDTLFSIEAVHGSKFSDVIQLGNSGGYVFARGGNDTITGGNGDDNIIPGSGNDVINGGNGRDHVDYGDDGNDVLGAPTSGVNVNLLTGISIDNWGGTDSLLSIEDIDGSSFGDKITGDGDDNKLSGNAGDDTLDGGSGNDWIIGGAGNDSAFGGAGDDWIIGGSGNDSIDGGSGQNTAGYNLGRVKTSDISGVSLVKGAGQTWTLSSGGSNWLAISQQSPTSNTLTITDLRSSSQIAIDGEVFGTDILNNIQTVGFDASYLDSSNNSQGFRAFNIILSGTGSSLALTLANKTIIGTPGNDILTGTSGDDTIMGLGGADTISSGAGNDQIDEIGNLVGSRIDGGAGADQLTVHTNGLDVLLDTNVTGIERFNINAPTSTSVQKVTITNSAFVGIQGTEIEVDSWNGQLNFDAQAVTAGNVNVYTGPNNDSLRGGSGNDELQGDGGNDTIAGGPGNDRFDGGDGIDTATFSGNKADYSLRSGGGNLYFISDLRPGSPDGSDIINNIESLSFADGVSDLSWASPAPVSNVQVNINTSLNGYNMFGSPSLNDLTGSHGDSTGSAGGPTFKFTSYDPVTRAFHVELYDPFVPTPNYSVGGASFYSQPFVSSGAMITGYISSGGPALPGAVNEIIGMSPFISWLMSSANVFLTEFKDVAFGSADGVSLNGNNFVFDTISGMNIDARTMLSDGLPAVLSGGDSISGGVGNDFLYGYGGNDTINGGAGSDTVVYSGVKSDYVVTAQSDGSYTIKDNVVGRDGTDKIFNVELAQFSDQTVNLPANITSSGLHGVDYFWKADANGKHALLSGVAVSASGGAQPAEGANAPIQLKHITWDAYGHATVDVYAHVTTAVDSVQINLGLGGATNAAFTSALPADWTLLGNPSGGGYVIGGYSMTALATGDVKLGTLTFDSGSAAQMHVSVDAGSTLSSSTIAGSQGTITATPYGYTLAHSTTGADGSYTISPLDPGSYALTASRSVSDIGAAITSADALAALKIAVGIDPNPGSGSSQLAVSPFQIMSADANQDGKVTSADALAILKMAVHMTTALTPEWMFVEETRDLSGLSRTYASWDHNISVNVQGDTTDNLVGMIKGDVNGSWTPPTGTQYVETNDPTHFTNLSNTIHAPLSEWGVL